LESLPGAVSLFARAYQRQTGGTQTGSEAIKTLLAAMKKGNVRGDILTFAGDIASETAASGVEKASNSSQAQEERLSNSVNDMAIIASAAGVEEAFARIFKTLSEGIDESSGMVESLAQSFNNATKYASYLLLIPQDFQRLMAGKDSVISDWLWGQGKQGEETLANMFEIRDVFKNIKDLGELSYGGWKQLFELMSENQGLQFFGRPLASLNQGLQAVLKAGNGDWQGAGEAVTNAAGGALDSVTAPGRAAAGGISGWLAPDKSDPNGVVKRYRTLASDWLARLSSGTNSDTWMAERGTVTEAGETITGNQINKAFDNPNYSVTLDPLLAGRYENGVNKGAISQQFVRDNLLYTPPTPEDPAVSGKPSAATRDQLLTQAANTVTSNSNNNTSNTFNFEATFQMPAGTTEQQAGELNEVFGRWFREEMGTAITNMPNNQ